MEKPLPNPPIQESLRKQSPQDAVYDDLVFGLKRYEAAFSIKDSIEDVLANFSKDEEKEMVCLSTSIAENPYQSLSLESVPSKILFGSFLFYVKDRIPEKAGYIIEEQFCKRLQQIDYDAYSFSPKECNEKLKNIFSEFSQMKLKMLSVFFSIVQILLPKLSGDYQEHVQFFASISAVVAPRGYVFEIYHAVEHLSLEAREVFQLHHPPSPKQTRRVVSEGPLNGVNYKQNTTNNRVSSFQNSQYSTLNNFQNNSNQSPNSNDLQPLQAEAFHSAHNGYSSSTLNLNSELNVMKDHDLQAPIPHALKQHKLPPIPVPEVQTTNIGYQTDLPLQNPNDNLVSLAIYEALYEKFLKACKDLEEVSKSYEESREEIEALHETFTEEVTSFQSTKRLKEEKIIQEKSRVDKMIDEYRQKLSEST